jgi:hypothetical protein
MQIKPALILAIVCWLNVFILAWLLILSYVPSEGVGFKIWIGFILLGIGSSAIISKKEIKDK